MAPPPLATATLGELTGFYLDVACSCPGHRPASLSVAGLAARAGPGPRLLDVVERLRCVACRRRPPLRVVLADQPAHPPGGRHAPPAQLSVVPRGSPT